MEIRNSLNKCNDIIQNWFPFFRCHNFIFKINFPYRNLLTNTGVRIHCMCRMVYGTWNKHKKFMVPITFVFFSFSVLQTENRNSFKRFLVVFVLNKNQCSIVVVLVSVSVYHWNYYSWSWPGNTKMKWDTVGYGK